MWQEVVVGIVGVIVVFLTGRYIVRSIRNPYTSCDGCDSDCNKCKKAKSTSSNQHKEL